MIEVRPIAAFQDNYIWVLQALGSNGVTVVDPGDADPVLRVLAAEGLHLEAILLTHHHADHIGGVTRLLAHASVPVFGPASPRMPQVDHAVQEGSRVRVSGIDLEVLEVPGHTLEHIAWFSPLPVTADNKPVLFCGDTLFVAGCGKMFEGTAPQMHASLCKLANLAPATKVFCAHEYTLGNLRFARHVLPDDAAIADRWHEESRKRKRGEPTVPSSVAQELASNPFLRCGESVVQDAVQAWRPGTGSGAAEVFGALRRWKDEF